jgi:hypothetical protein
MLLALICAIVHPLITNKGKCAALRGGLIGLALALFMGLFLPQKTTRVTPLQTMRLEKHSVSASDTQPTFAIQVIDQHRRISLLDLKAHDATITVGDSNAVHVYQCLSSFEHPWMNYLFVCIPQWSYEIEVPKQMADTILAPPTQVMPDGQSHQVVYERKLSDETALAQ